MTVRRISVLAVSLFLTACAAPETRKIAVDDALVQIEKSKQADLAVREFIEMENRMIRLTYPIVANGLPICQTDSVWDAGVAVWNKNKGTGHFRDAYERVFGLTEVLQIRTVQPNSPAEKAGLEVGDLLVGVNDWSAAVGDKAIDKYYEAMADFIKTDEPQTFRIMRDGRQLSIVLHPHKVCSHMIVVQQSDKINAFADGSNIIFTSGMIDFARTDDELAMVIGHELAHNYMRHIDKAQANRTAGQAGGLIIDILLAGIGINTGGHFSASMGNTAGLSYSQDFESEADYVGLYFTALGGYDFEKSPEFWRRMAARHPGSIAHAVTHPTSPERFVRLDKTIEEIKMKQAMGLPMVPDPKEPERIKEGGSVESDQPSLH